MKRKTWGTILLLVPAVAGLLSLNALKNDLRKKNNNFNLPAADNAGLTLPAGFNASIIADNLGGARHLAVTPQNEIYVKLRGASDGKGIVLLHQADGKAEVKSTFGPGGTGIYIKSGYLYASTDEEVYRYKLNAANEVINSNKPELIITGLLSRHEHEPKAII